MWRIDKGYSIFCLLLVTFGATFGVKAQSKPNIPVTFDIQGSSHNEQVVSHILRVVNHSQEQFKGSIQLDSLRSVRPLTQSVRELSLEPEDTIFVVYRYVVGKEVEAGEKIFLYNLLNSKGSVIVSQTSTIEIAVREQLFLFTDDLPLVITQSEDSVRIQASVKNGGNTPQEVTLVFNVPNQREVPAFTELTITLAPMEQRRIVHSFVPSHTHLSSGQFSVHVTAMKGKEKTIFGSKTILVQNVFSERRYIDFHLENNLLSGQLSSNNSLSLSYRQYNAGSSLWQMQGGGNVNLPLGYLQFKGNVYRYNTGHTPYVTNTSLLYAFNENEVTIGNVNEQSELHLFGRGVKVSLSPSTGDKNLTIGAIDQNFNLIDRQPWFSDHYSFYIQGSSGNKNADRGMKATYVYQRNPYERANYHVGGFQWRNVFGKSWSVQMDSHGALSNYDNISRVKFSGAVGLSYKGVLPRRISLDGSGYYSDGHFPGSRKGTLNFTQGITKNFSDNIFISGSVGYNKTEPLSYVHSYSYRSENTYGSLMLSLPEVHRVASSLYYRYQKENSPSDASLTGSTDISNNIKMSSHRLGWQWRWQSRENRHSLFGTLEGGFFNHSLGKRSQEQLRATLNYSFSGLMVDASYQRGAFYIYEYIMARQLDKNFNRFTTSFSFNKMIAKRLSIATGINLSHDVYQGSVPSANLTANYLLRENITLFSNAYWYKYNLGYNANIYHSQLGVTWHFNRVQPVKGKKSKIAAHVYYDYNGNNRYDDGDESTKGYLLSIDKRSFISNNDGEIHYSLVPYGEYEVRPMQSGKWVFDRKKINVNSSRTQIDIPLKQTGTIRGSVVYIIRENSVEIALRYEGFMLTVMNEEGEVIQTIVTDEEGNFTSFLPMGVYSILLNEHSLPEYSDCKDLNRKFTVEAGKTTNVDPFEIEVKERKINIKRFYAAE